MNVNNNKFKPGLYCVATPIGNMGDITLRAIETLKQSDLILCEDTRVSKKILQKFEINKKIISNHKFNENKNLEKVLELLKNRKGIDIFPIPGASAVSTAISISGFSDNFYFCGFLPEKQNQVKKLFKDLSLLNGSIVFFISPNKLNKKINEIKEYFLNRDVLICREITKYHEEYIRTPIKELSNLNFSRKGEITVVISEQKKENLSFKELEESDKKKIKKLIKNMSIKDIVKKVSEDRDISKKLIYKYCLEIKNEN
jgi:16S rRNA (cytidine1402-2'-O)-methyltransferase